MATRHVPVLLDEIVEVLARRPEGLARRADGLVSPRLVDCTLGGAGHAVALLEACPGAELLGIDRVAAAIERCSIVLAPFAGRVSLVHGDYRQLARMLEKKVGRVRSAPSLPTSASRASNSRIRSVDSRSSSKVPSTCASTPVVARLPPNSSRPHPRTSWSRSFGVPTNRTRDASLGRSSMPGGAAP